jgi:hypothetical protein
MLERHSTGEFATVELARKVFDFPLPMLRRLAESGRVRWRVDPDERIRLSLEDLRELANQLGLEEYQRLSRAGDEPLTGEWRHEEELIRRSWSGHTTEDVWDHERALWIKMGRRIREPAPPPAGRGEPG